MQCPDHFERERALAGEHLGDLVGAAQIGREIPRPEFLLLHADADCVDWIWEAEREAFILVAFHEEGQKFQFVRFPRPRRTSQRLRYFWVKPASPATRKDPSSQPISFWA